MGEVSGDVRVDYVVSDVEGDSVRLRVEYSVNGVDWNRASIVGDTLVGRGGYSGYLIWRSGLDLPNYGGDVIFRIVVYWFLDLGMRYYGRQVLIWLV